MLRQYDDKTEERICEIARQTGIDIENIKVWDHVFKETAVTMETGRHEGYYSVLTMNRKTYSIRSHNYKTAKSVTMLLIENFMPTNF